MPAGLDAAGTAGAATGVALKAHTGNPPSKAAASGSKHAAFLTSLPWPVRRVPLALIWTILAQTGLAVWWARGQQAAIEKQEQRNEQQSQRIAALEQARISDRVGERLSTLESQMMDAKDVLRRIDERTQRLVERSARADR